MALKQPPLNITSFVQAILMNRFQGLLSERECLEPRRKILSDLLKALQKNSFLLENAPNDPPIQEMLKKLLKGLELLESKGALEEARKYYSQAVDQLTNLTKLNRSDEKKWPHLKPDEKAIRILTNKLYSCPCAFASSCLYRCALEKIFRLFNALEYLYLTERYLSGGKLDLAEQELIFSQEEVRHLVALTLGVDLALLREEAETLSQTTGRSEREITLELIDRLFKQQSSSLERLSKQLKSFLEHLSPAETFVKEIRQSHFAPREVKNLKSEGEIISLLRQQNEDMTLTLSTGFTLPLENFLKKLLYLPEAKTHTYFRMPDVDRFKKIKILDSEKTLLVEFDEQGRLCFTRAPVIDVAIIGGGPGGIAAAVALFCLGIFRVTLFERTEANSTIRDIWSREKEADTFYSGPPGKIEGVVNMQDTSRAVFLNRMQSFIDYFHLNLRTREPVMKLYRAPPSPTPSPARGEGEIFVPSPLRGEGQGEGGPLWILETPQGTYQARAVIMTAGRYGKPRLLKWEEGNLSEEARKRIIRGVEVDDIQHSNVLVIGGGNTAFDNVKSLSAQGTGKKGNQVFLSYYKKPFNVPGSLHVHNNEQLLQWETEGKVKILWNTNTESVEPIEDSPSPQPSPSRGEGAGGGGKTRLKVNFRQGETPASILVDYITPAVGWQIDRKLMEKVGVKFSDGKNPDYDPETGQALIQEASGRKVPLPGLFITGDYADQKSVPAALTSNFRAALALASQLENK